MWHLALIGLAVLGASSAARAQMVPLPGALPDAPGQKALPPNAGNAAAVIASGKSFLTNGDFEQPGPGEGADMAADWGRALPGVSWVSEPGNHFLRLTQTQPGATIALSRFVLLPSGTKALTFTWRQRLADVRATDSMFHDARILLTFRDGSGQALAPSPLLSARGITKGWTERIAAFLVPAGAVGLEIMPELVEVQAGTFDLDDLALAPTDPAPVAARLAAQAEAAREAIVPPEQPNKARWPAELHVQGNRLVNPEGKEVWLQGICVDGWETAPYDLFVTKAAKVGVEDWHASIVRVPVKEDFWYGRSELQQDGGALYRRNLDDLVTMVANRGAYVLLDLHRYRTPQPAHADFWKDAAAHYKDHPALLFDLLNEPHDTSWEIWRNGGQIPAEKISNDQAAFLSPEEKAKRDAGVHSVGMQGLVDAVRSTGAHNVLVVGGLAYANDLSGVVNGYALDDPGGHGIVYSWHCYNWHKGWEQHVLGAAARFPILVGECGVDPMKMDFIPAAAQEDYTTWAPDMLGLIQKYRLNWTGFCMHPRSSPRMLMDWNFTPTPFWGAYVKDALAGKPFEMKRMR